MKFLQRWFRQLSTEADKLQPVVGKSVKIGDIRISKLIANSGVCSRYIAEQWVKEGRVMVNGETVRSPVFCYSKEDSISVDGVRLRSKYNYEVDPTSIANARPRLWATYKKCGEIIRGKRKDETRQQTMDRFLSYASNLRLDFNEQNPAIPVTHLDFNTEGICLITNSKRLAKLLNDPNSPCSLKEYRVRVHGKVTESKLKGLAKGLNFDGIRYYPMHTKIEHNSSSNSWVHVSTNDNHDHGVRKCFEKLFLQINRMIVTSHASYTFPPPTGTNASSCVELRLVKEINSKLL